jgi:hypothetical protein
MQDGAGWNQFAAPFARGVVADDMPIQARTDATEGGRVRWPGLTSKSAPDMDGAPIRRGRVNNRRVNGRGHAKQFAAPQAMRYFCADHALSDPTTP